MTAKPAPDPAQALSGESHWIYTNSFSIETSLSEVCLSFGQAFQQVGQRHVHSRLVTTPVHLRRLANAVNGAVSEYEEVFGRIPDGDTPKAGD